jgi:putative membrane protein
MTSKFRKLILQIIAGIFGIWLATQFVTPGVTFTGTPKTLLLMGLILGLLNFFIKPILNLITLPLRVLTLGLFSIVVNMAIVWIVDVLFVDLQIAGLIPLFWTTIIVWILSLIASKV